MTDPSSARSLPGPTASSLTGLDPVGLLDAVLGSDTADWQPPPPEELETALHGFDSFEFLARGGMGAVYAARQKSLDRRVAIKVLPPELGKDAVFVERFEQEARLLAKLQHPHIVTIYDFGSTAAGHLFIVMEFVKGTSLLEIMKAGRIPVVRTLEIVCEVCEALQYAHEHGVIHRDIKPNNILFDERGKVRVADFGLAKLTDAGPAGTTTSHTQAGKVVGTPGYASPEQRRGEREVDCRADVFSLGVTLYEMLTGQLPVGVFDSPSRKTGSPPALDRVVLRALQERPELRYQTAAQMKKTVEVIAAKLGAPSFRRQILQRPLTAAVIAIQLLATGWLLSDKLTRRESLPALPDIAATSGFLESTEVIPLTGRFALLEESMSWNRARESMNEHPGYRLATIRESAEQEAVFQALDARMVRQVWLGGHRPQGAAEFEWLDGSPVSYAAWQPGHAEPPVIMTEIQAKNNSTLLNSFGSPADWVEVYNPGDQPVDLEGWRFMELVPNRGAEGRLMGHGKVSTIIQPRSYRLIFFGMRQRDEKELSMAFNLESTGALLRWSDPRGQVIQYFNRPWPRFEPDSSIGCAENGSDWGVCEAPTPGQPNRRRVTSISGPEYGSDATMAILLEVEAGGGWTMEMPQRKAWLLLEKVAVKN